MSDVKILDGALGSELIRRGIDLPEHIWSADANLSSPELVLQIHKEYIKAGADYITANTFRTTLRAFLRMKSSRQGATAGAKDSLNKAVHIARKAAGSRAEVLGSIAPLEDCYSPHLFPGRDAATNEFRQLGKWLCDSGVNILLLETMNSMIETEAGIIALQGFETPIWVSFVLRDSGHLLSGDKISDTLNRLKKYSVDMVLLNCNPLARTTKAVDTIVDNWSGKWGVYPNLGRGKPSPDGKITEVEPMEKFLAIMVKAIEMGASVVGGCCGSTPEHIARLKSTLSELAKLGTTP